MEGQLLGSQSEIDEYLCELDGTEGKSRLGANAILGVSLAALHARAHVQKKSLFDSMNPSATTLPTPLMNIVNGGSHANNGLDVQEFMIVPVCGGSFREALRVGCEIFHALKKELSASGQSVGVGDEGGFAPALDSNQKALEFILKACEKAGYRPGEDVHLALDVAASEFYKNEKYQWEGQELSSGELQDVYSQWLKAYPIVSIEDPFAEDDWQAWNHFMKQEGKKVQIVGDDLFVTNPKRLQRGVDENSANALLVKVNQIGTVTEALEATKLAHSSGFQCVMSHRSGETEDTTLADLAVAWGCSQVKTGSLSRGERTAKYNRFLRIEEEKPLRFLGLSAFPFKSL